MPVSRILVNDREMTIRLVGSPPPVKGHRRPSVVFHGEVSATFRVLSRTAESRLTMESNATVRVFFYYCLVGAYWNGQSCVSCVSSCVSCVGLMLAMIGGEKSLE